MTRTPIPWRRSTGSRPRAVTTVRSEGQPGIDKGTLDNRFDEDFARGSVVGKTGTLGVTDGGASALAGEINTKNGKLLFVIFNKKGSVAKFRSFSKAAGSSPPCFSRLSLARARS